MPPVPIFVTPANRPFYKLPPPTAFAQPQCPVGCSFPEQYSWMDTSPYDFLYWAIGNPNIGSHRCSYTQVGVAPEGWININCDNTLLNQW